MRAQARSCGFGSGEEAREVPRIALQKEQPDDLLNKTIALDSSPGEGTGRGGGFEKKK